VPSSRGLNRELRVWISRSLYPCCLDCLLGHMRRQSRFVFFSIVFLAAVSISHLVQAQVGPASATRRQITRPVDEGSLVTLRGNTRPEANATNDRGPSQGLSHRHMQIQLRLPAEKEQELEQLNRDLVDPASQNFHKWLTPDQFRQEFSWHRKISMPSRRGCSLKASASTWSIRDRLTFPRRQDGAQRF